MPQAAKGERTDAVEDGRIERPMTAWHCCLDAELIEEIGS